MMEDLAIKVNNLSELKYIQEFPNWGYPKNRMTDAFSDEICRTLQNLSSCTIDRIYFGSEFCEWILPSDNDFSKVIDYCCTHGLKITLLLPPLSEKMLYRLDNLIRIIHKAPAAVQCEVACNDIGAIHYLHTCDPSIVLLRGRLFQKRIYDPRVDVASFNRKLTTEGKLVYYDSAISLYEVNVLERMNIRRIELDTHIDYLHAESIVGFKHSCYLPFGFFTTGHMCMFQNYLLTSNEKFDLKKSSCSKHCKQYYHTMSKRITESQSFITSNLMFFRTGNTIFFNNKIIGDISLLSQYRIVLQPFPIL